MTYDERKQAQRCTRPGCASPPADGHSLCVPHRDEHRRRNRRWWRQLREALAPLSSLRTDMD